MDKLFSPACERNKEPILNILKKYFTDPKHVLEIGSWTGQHAIHLSQNLPHLTWQPTDQGEYLEGLKMNIKEANLKNILEPLSIDVSQETWPVKSIDYAFSANTVHIMSWEHVETFFPKLGSLLQENGIFCLYGPFNYQGQYSSESNAKFDIWLKERDPLSAIRDFEKICELASSANMNLIHDHEMPANNRILVFQKKN